MPSDPVVPVWQPMDTAPRDKRFWGREEENDGVVVVFWHPHFAEFISSCREMRMHGGYTFEDGSTVRLHSPEVHKLIGWMPMPAGQQ